MLIIDCGDCVVIRNKLLFEIVAVTACQNLYQYCLLHKLIVLLM